MYVCILYGNFYFDLILLLSFFLLKHLYRLGLFMLLVFRGYTSTRPAMMSRYLVAGEREQKYSARARMYYP